MKYSEAQPASLAHYVKCFWSLERERPEDVAAKEPILPDGCVEIVFNLGDRFQRFHADGTIELQPRSIIAGQMRGSVLIGPTGRVRLFGIRFQPAGAGAFFRFPLFEITDRIEPLQAVWSNEGCYLIEKLAATETFEEASSLVEFELSKVLRCGRSATLVGQVVHEIEKARGSAPTCELGKAYGLSERQLERLFKESVGLSPKMFSRIVRFQNVIKSLESGRGDELLDMALDYGYFDQSHMIREFKEFAGKSPLRFIAGDHRISEFFVGTA